jgi:N utilization substance protein B
LQYVDDAPAQVAINEALEIAKRYSIEDSVSFINGILDAVQTALPK